MASQVPDIAGQFLALGVPFLRDPGLWASLVPKSRSARMQASAMNPGMATVTSILRRLMMRHSKSMAYAADGSSLLTLPPKLEHIQWIQFNDEEQVKYNQLEKHVRAKYERLIALGGNSAVSSNTIKLLSLVKDLQMVCSGGFVPNRLADILNQPLPDPAAPEAAAATINALSDEEDEDGQEEGECAICLNLFDNPVDTPCNHRFCAVCIQAVIAEKFRPECPLCRASISNDRLRYPNGDPLQVPILAAGAGHRAEGAIMMDDDGYNLNAVLAPVVTPAERLRAQAKSATAMLSKLAWLVSKLQDIRTHDPTAKVLIFSQFGCTLEWLQEELPRRGFEFRTLTGSMSMAQRKKALETFQNDPPTTVFLLSMRAGAVGINLTEANHVIVLEPCLNKALEDQAIGRVHRMGQRREVHVYKAACLGTVEERILKMQERDKPHALADETNSLTVMPNTSPAEAPVTSPAAATGNETSRAGSPSTVALTTDLPFAGEIATEDRSKWITLPLTFAQLSVSSSNSPAEGRQNLLAAGDAAWVPGAADRENGEAWINIDVKALAHTHRFAELGVCLKRSVNADIDCRDIVVEVSNGDGDKTGHFRKIVHVEQADDGWLTLLERADFRAAQEHFATASVAHVTPTNTPGRKSAKARREELNKRFNKSALTAINQKITTIKIIFFLQSIPTGKRARGKGKDASIAAELSSLLVQSLRMLGENAPVERKISSAGMGTASSRVAVQETSGSITSDRAAVNRDQFDVLFGCVELPVTLLRSTMDNKFVYGVEQTLNLQTSALPPTPAADTTTAVESRAHLGRRTTAGSRSRRPAKIKRANSSESDIEFDEEEAEEEAYSEPDEEEPKRKRKR